MALESTQTLSKMSSRNLPEDKGQPYVSRLSRKCGSLDVSQPYGPPRHVTTGIALLSFLPYLTTLGEAQCIVEEFCLLGCNAVESIESQPTFRRRYVPPKLLLTLNAVHGDMSQNVQHEYLVATVQGELRSGRAGPFVKVEGVL
jgi:hypothetical protein